MAEMQYSEQLCGVNIPTTTGAVNLDVRRAVYETESVRLLSPQAFRLLQVVRTPSGVVFRFHAIDANSTAPPYTALSYAWRSPLRQMQRFDFSKDVWCTIICQVYENRTGWQGHRMLVLQNLHSALTHIVSLQPPVEYLWADDLCIDQSNLEEKKKQVQQMGRIFQQAERTVAWLGESDEASDKAIPLINALCKLSREQAQLLHPQNLDGRLGQALLPGCSSLDHWKSLALFFRRSWFSRAWVVQEVILTVANSQPHFESKSSALSPGDGHNSSTFESDEARLLVLCGPQRLSWTQLTFVSDLLITGDLGRHFSDPTVYPFDHDQNAVSLSHGSPAKLASAARGLYKTHSFLPYLIRARDFDSSDPRDKIYSLLSIARENFRISATANYQISTQQTYTAIARQMLTDSVDDERLHILHQVECRRAPQHQDLPSWVPDWSCSGGIGLGITSYRRYAAAGDLPIVQPHFADDGKTLILKGSQIAIISKTGETKKEVENAKPLQFPGWLALLEELQERAAVMKSSDDADVFETLWRTLVVDTDREGKCPADNGKWRLGTSFREWVVALARKNQDPSDSQRAPGDTPQGTSSALRTTTLFEALCALHRISSPHVRDSLERMCARSSKTDSVLKAPISQMNAYIDPKHSHDASLPGISILPTAHHDFELCFSHRVLLRLFLTNTGHLGLGTDALLPNDTLWLVPGSRVPLILRPFPGSYGERGKSRYSLIGGAYVHGIMHGELLNDPMCAPLHDGQSEEWVEIV